MDVVNDTTLVNVFNIIGGLGTILSVTVGVYFLFSKCCCKRIRCVCRIQICEPIEEDEPVPEADSVSVSVNAVPEEPETVRTRVLITQPPPTAESTAETITLIQPPPPRPRFF